jgi:predicted RNase H-like HicB family nuclease
MHRPIARAIWPANPKVGLSTPGHPDTSSRITDQPFGYEEHPPRPATPVARRSATIEPMSRVIHLPYTLEQDEDGVWCASAQLRPGVGAVGDGATPEEALADLREAVTLLIEEVGAPPEMTLTLDVA